MSLNKKLLAIMTALMLAGCAAPNQTTVMKSDPSEAGKAPVNYRRSIQKHLQDTLVDPGSLQGLVIGTPKSSQCKEKIYAANKSYENMLYGWVVSVQFSAKNTSGGYSAKQYRHYWFQGETIRNVKEEPVPNEYGGTKCPMFL